MRDHDSERKEKGKVYADCQRNACEGEIQEGDKVLLRPEKENKLSSLHTNSKANGIESPTEYSTCVPELHVLTN